MLIRHHLLLTLGCAFLLMIPFLSLYPPGGWVFLCGAGIGSVLPDFHMKRPSRWQNPKNLAFLLTRVTSRFFVPLIMVVTRYVFRLRPDPLDKRLTHSGMALLVYGVGVLLTCGLLLLDQGHGAFHLIQWFLLGSVFGFLFHLIEDACTKKGICPLFPLDSRLFLVGSIRPCQTDDYRIPAFIILLFLSAFGFLWGSWGGFLAGGNLPFLSGTVIVLFIITMSCFSGMKTERRDDRRFRSPQPVLSQYALENEDPKPFKG